MPVSVSVSTEIERRPAAPTGRFRLPSWRIYWRVQNWRWGSYLIANIISFLVPVVGAIAQKSEGQGLLLIVAGLYCGWGVAMGVFIWSQYNRSPLFIVRAMFHALCGACAMYYVDSVGEISADDLYIWIPVSTMCGIFMAVGLETCFFHIWKQLRSCKTYASRVLTRSRSWILDSLGAEDRRPLLPTQRDDTQPGSYELGALPGTQTTPPPSHTEGSSQSPSNPTQ